MNGIVVRGNAVGECLFHGPGAGSLATASAVVADVLDAVKHRHRRKDWGWAPAQQEQLRPARELECRWFLRTTANLAELGAAFGNVHFITFPGADPGEYAFVTPPMDEARLEALTEGMPLQAKYRMLD